MTGFQFLSQPQDACISIDEDVFFSCISTESSYPYWRINGVLLSSYDLPNKHFYNGSGLLIRNIDSSFNGSVYSCIFLVFIPETGITVQEESTRGIITIHSGLRISHIISHKRPP